MNPFIHLARMISRVATAPLATQEGQLIYQRTSTTTGRFYGARFRTGGSYEWQVLGGGYLFALPPLYIHDLTGTGTTEANPAFWDADTTSTIATSRRLRMGKAGSVVGAFIATDDARTAGTATLKVLVNSTAFDFNSGSVVLDGTTTLSKSDFVHASAGVAFSANNTLGIQVVTSGWTPTTANIVAGLWVQLTPYD